MRLLELPLRNDHHKRPGKAIHHKRIANRPANRRPGAPLPITAHERNDEPLDSLSFQRSITSCKKNVRRPSEVVPLIASTSHPATSCCACLTILLIRTGPHLPPFSTNSLTESGLRPWAFPHGHAHDALHSLRLAVYNVVALRTI